ncbi:MAG: LuxR C-terminal-related transcriptional regulator [Myxococcota bacterium]|jgi:PAS domain S-box-containing protein
MMIPRTQLAPTTSPTTSPTQRPAVGTQAAAALAALDNSRAPVLTLDAKGQVVSWNAACERLVGMRKEEARGKMWREVLSIGRNDDGREMVAPRGSVAVESFEVNARTATGVRRLAMIPVPIDPDASAGAAAWAYVIHALPANLSDEERRLGRQELGLTQRELEVVELLARGKATEEIAGLLHIARTTARNHIQSVLQKLGVHSRLEAVAHLRQHGVV